MGDGTAENPYARKDVLRLIEENGSTAEGLDLSGKVFEEYINLSKLDLKRIIFSNPKYELGFPVPESAKAKLNKANLTESQLIGANLNGLDLRHVELNKANLSDTFMWEVDLRGSRIVDTYLIDSDLRYANFGKAFLCRVNLQGANLLGANLEGANLYMSKLQNTSFHRSKMSRCRLIGSTISHDTKFDDVDWGKEYILQEEEERYFDGAQEVYRNLKQWHTEHGIYDIAGKFFYREMECRRKAQSWKKNFGLKLWYSIIRILAGYGEKPERVAISAAAVIILAALVYLLIGSPIDWSAFGRSLYFSAASFTALGYGSWIAVESNVIRGLGAAESFLGVFMMALFLVTFTRKMTR